MSDQKKLQHINLQLIRENRRLELELQKREGSCRLRVVAKLAGDRSSIAAVAKRFHEAVARKKVQSPLTTNK
jgi:hypothetical protein